MRDLQPADCERLRQWRNLPDVARWMFTDHIITEEEHRSWFDLIGADDRRRYWVITRRSEDIGLAHLSDIDRANARCSLGIYIAVSSARGTGAAMAALYHMLASAFDDLGLNKVTCEALADNRDAIALYERVGFRREGLLRQHIRKGDRAIDVVALAMIRSEFDLCRCGIKDRLTEKGALL